MDKNQKQIDASAVITVRTAGYTYQDGSYATSNGIEVIAFIQNLYVTSRFTEPYRADLVFRVNKVETKIVSQDVPSYAVKMEHGYHIYNQISTYSNSATVYGPSLNVSYYVDSIHNGYYPYHGGIQDGICTYYIVTINYGASVSSIKFIPS